MSTSNKNATRGGRSPAKSRTQKFNQADNSQAQNDSYINNLDKDLVNGLNEKDVEIEHLKTTVVALSEKVIVSTPCSSIYIPQLYLSLLLFNECMLNMADRSSTT